MSSGNLGYGAAKNRIAIGSFGRLAIADVNRIGAKTDAWQRM